MATTTNVSSNYAGKVAGAIIGKSFKEADTLRLGLLTVAENVNYKYNLRKIDYTDGSVDYSCGFTAGGQIDLTEKELVIKKIMNNIQVCKEDFRQTWSEDSMGASAHNVNAPADIMEAIQVEVLQSQAEKVDAEIWSGDGTAGKLNGLIPQFEADGSVTTVVGTAITEANVEAELKKFLAAVPVEIRRKNLQVVVAPNVFQAYSFYLISKGIANDGTADEKQVKFGKYMLTEVNGLPDDTMVAYEKANITFATGLQADFNELTFVDEDEIGLLSGFVRGKIVYGAAVGYYNSEDIVYYDPTV